MPAIRGKPASAQYLGPSRMITGRRSICQIGVVKLVEAAPPITFAAPRRTTASTAQRMPARAQTESGFRGAAEHATSLPRLCYYHRNAAVQPPNSTLHNLLNATQKNWTRADRHPLLRRQSDEKKPTERSWSWSKWLAAICRCSTVHLNQREARQMAATAWSRKVGTGFRKRSCSNNNIERDDDSKKSHRAL